MLYFFAPILMNCVESIFSYMLYGIKSYWRSFEIILELGANGKQTNTTHWQENLVRVFNFRGSPTLQQHFKHLIKPKETQEMKRESYFCVIMECFLVTKCHLYHTSGCLTDAVACISLPLGSSSCIAPHDEETFRR